MNFLVTFFLTAGVITYHHFSGDLGLEGWRLVFVFMTTWVLGYIFFEIMDVIISCVYKWWTK